MSARALSFAALLLLVARGALAAETTVSGFDVTVIALSPEGGEILAEPVPAPSSNLHGDTAFATAAGETQVAYLRYANGLRLRLLGSGDPLAGSRVKRVVVSGTSLDQYRQVLLYATLEDGRSGLFRLTSRPVVLGVTPKWGYRDGPVAFHLLGDGFAPGMEVLFGDVKAGFVTAISRTEITGVIAAPAVAATVAVAVARPGGSRLVLKNAFEFRDRPTTGCADLWPDHRPPAQTSAVALPWWLAVVLAARVRRRRGLTITPWASRLRHR